MSSETSIDFTGARATVINTTDYSLAELAQVLNVQNPMVASLVRWGQQSHPPSRRGTVADRDRFVTPHSVFEKIRTARQAMTDDVVGGVADTTESLVFDESGFFAEDLDEEDAWNQWAGDVDLDNLLRCMWRQLFSDSQVCVAQWNGTQSYTVRGRTEAGNQRRKPFKNLAMPLAFSIIDTVKVAPVGSLMFGQEQLAYIADSEEARSFDAILGLKERLGIRQLRPTIRGPADTTEMSDEIVSRLMLRRYTPDRAERQRLDADGVDHQNLFELDEASVWRHTLTRPDHKRFADVRMEGVFELLDIKHQLHAMDRAWLIGGPLRVDQRIPTPDGWKPIGAARVGDRVFSVDGKPTDIVGVYPQGILPMYRITFSDGAEVVCDEHHPWTVRTPKGSWRTITLEQIMAEGLTQSNGVGSTGCGQIRRCHEVPMAAAVELPEADLPLDPYLVGQLLGNGGLSRITPNLACFEPPDDRPWVDALLDNIQVRPDVNSDFVGQFRFGRVPTGRRRGQPGWVAGQGRRPNPMAEVLRDLDLMGHVAQTKFIPELYLRASIPQRWALLQGMSDTDGTARVGGPEIATTSEKLADGIVELVQSLGGLAYKHERDLTGTQWSKPGDSMFIVGCQFDNDWGSPFRLKRKTAGWSQRKRPLTRTMVKIERVEDAEAVCIKTARDDGLFCTEGYVTTHNTSYLVLVRKGTDALPAEQVELDNLNAQFRIMARVPVIIGDHRLSVDIVTPKVDLTLNRPRYDTLDVRLAARLLQTFVPTGADSDDPLKLGKVIAEGLESRRKMIRRRFEAKVVRPIMAANEQFTSRPKLVFKPSQISLAFDDAWSSFLLELRASNEISRETMLGSFGLDQADEARRREREAIRYDDIFQTQQPFGTPNPALNPGGLDTASPAGKRAAGRRGGGNRNGGGSAPGSGQGQPARRPGKKSDGGTPA